MSESIARNIQGIHDVRFFSRTDWSSIAHFRVLGDVNIEMSAEFAELKGGSNLFVWDSAISAFNPKVSIVCREMSADIVSALADGNVTEYAADANGDVLFEANVSGSTIYDATTGIATITALSGSESNLKEGWYVAAYSAAAKVKIYALSSAGFSQGTDITYDNDDGYTGDDITITTGGNTDITDLGLRFTGGSGAIAFTSGHSMKFYVQKIHGGAYTATLGEQPMTFPEMGCIISSEDNAGTIYNMLLYRVKAAGMSFPFKEKGYGEYTINMSVMYDSAQNAIGVFKCTTAA